MQILAPQICIRVWRFTKTRVEIEFEVIVRVDETGIDERPFAVDLGFTSNRL